MAVYSFFHQRHIQLLLKMLGPQLAEVIIGIHVVQCEDEVDQSLSTARKGRDQGALGWTFLQCSQVVHLL